MNEYFDYFSDIEQYFCRRRGTNLMVSTIDWALMEVWKEAGIPLEAIFRGIDATFDKWDKRQSKTRKVNGLGFCAQEVLAAAEEMREAEVGSRPKKQESTLPADEVADYLKRNAELVEKARASLPQSAQQLATETAGTLRDLAAKESRNFEDMERRLTVMEDKLFAALLASTPDEQLVNVRADAEREMSAYRRNMSAAQIEQLQKQYVHKRLLEKYGLPRLSLFYMS